MKILENLGRVLRTKRSRADVKRLPPPPSVAVFAAAASEASFVLLICERSERLFGEMQIILIWATLSAERWALRAKGFFQAIKNPGNYSGAFEGECAGECAGLKNLPSVLRPAPNFPHFPADPTRFTHSPGVARGNANNPFPIAHKCNWASGDQYCHDIKLLHVNFLRWN